MAEELREPISTENLIKELIQVAAVALSFAEHCEDMSRTRPKSSIEEIAELGRQARNRLEGGCCKGG